MTSRVLANHPVTVLMPVAHRLPADDGVQALQNGGGFTPVMHEVKRLAPKTLHPGEVHPHCAPE